MTNSVQRQGDVTTSNPVTHYLCDEPITADVTTSNLRLVSRGKQYENIEGYLTSAEDEYFRWLSEVKTLPEMVSLFRQAESDIGHSEILCSKMLCLIHSEKLWIRLGYLSESAFIRDLIECGIGTRQSYYRMVKTGYTLFALNAMRGLYPLSQSYGDLCKCYSKFPALSKIIIDQKDSPFWKRDEVLDHFFNDKCREFTSYVSSVLVKIKECENPGNKERKVRRSKESASVRVELSLTGAKSRLYEEFVLGHRIVFLLNKDDAFLNSIELFFEKSRSKKLDELNSRSHSEINRYLSNFSLSKHLDDLNAAYAEFQRSEWRYCYGTGGMFSPEVVKRLFRFYDRSKTELTLIQAYLIHRIGTEQELKNDMQQFGASSAKAFALNVLKIDISQYKRLKRIGKNLFLADKLHGEIDITGVGFLEKLYFLDVALKNHRAEKVIDCFAQLSAKQFREFARNPSYEFGNVSVSNKEYKELIQLFDKYESLSFGGKSVNFIGLRSDAEYSSLNEILLAAEPDQASRRKLYPDIWNTNTSVVTHQVA